MRPMTDRAAIRVGDLVQVVRSPPCCGNEKNISRIFVVEDIGIFGSVCAYCGRAVDVIAAKGLKGAGTTNSVRMSRLKRIPPLEELEGEKRDEEITA